MRRLLLILALGAPLTAAQALPALPDAFAEATQMAASGDHDAARRQFQALADRGFAPAEAMMGLLYLNGRGVASSPAIAAAWFYKSARKGYPPAQLALAQLQWTGRGVAFNDQEAYFWSRLAAQRGRPEVRAQALALARTISGSLADGKRQALDRAVAAWRPELAILQ